MKIDKLFLFTALAVLCACTTPSAFDDPKPLDPDKLPQVEQVLVPAPALAEHGQVAQGGRSVREPRLTVEDKNIQSAPITAFWSLTFNGEVPAPITVAHEGDYVEVTLVNPKTN